MSITEVTSVKYLYYLTPNPYQTNWQYIYEDIQDASYVGKMKL